MKLPKNQTSVPNGPRADWAIGSSVTAMANTALIAEETNLARVKAKPCKSAASKIIGVENIIRLEALFQR